MKVMRYAAAALAILVGGIAQAQTITTTTTATIVDSDGTAWINAPYTIKVVSAIPPVTAPDNTQFPYSFSGTLDNTGSFSLALQRVSNIYPTGSTWRFCVSPAVTNPATYCTNVPVGNAGQSTQDVSTQINAVIKAPRIGGGILKQGYSDVEFQATPGNQYYNVVTNVFQCYSTGWASCAGTASGIASITWVVPSILLAAPTTLNGSGTQTFLLTTQLANTVFAGPASGGSDVPAFRALVSADIPNNTAISGGLTGSPSINIANLTGSGTVTLNGIQAVSGSSCLQINAFGTVSNTGLPCGSGGGGGGSFSAVTAGTNTAALVMGAGGTLTPSGGTITANAYSGFLPVANGGTGSSPAAGSQVFVSASSSTGAWSSVPAFSGVSITSLNASNISSGALAFARLATMAADTLLGNASGSTSTPAAVSLVSCSSGTNALTYNTTTHAFGCNTISSGGSGTVNSGVANQIAMYASTGTAVSGDTLLTDTGTALAYAGTGGFSLGSTPPTACVGAGCIAMSETSTAGTPTAGADYIRADSTSHTIKMSLNGGAEVSIPSSGGSMTWPGAGVAVSTGTAWATSLAPPTGAIVGTSDAQTLTNKSIDGSEINSGFIPTAVLPKVIQGVSYSNRYAGSTVDVRVNACIVDAETLANGNTSGVCDARGEAGAQTIAAQITLGDSSFDKATLLLPAGAVWTATNAAGTQCALEQWGNTSLIGSNPAAGINISAAISVGSGSSLAHNYCTGNPINTSGANYYYVQGVAFLNLSSGAVTSTGVGNLIQGSYDVSTWDHVDFFDTKDAIDLQVYAVCCETSIKNSTINANYVGLPLSIIGDSSNGVKALNIDTTSIVHPGPGLAIMSATDTGAAHVSTVNFNDIYSETSNSDTTTPFYQLSGFGQVNFHNVTVTSEVASNGANVITVAAVGTPQVNIQNVALVNGAGSFSLPQKVLVDSSHTVTLFSDAAGHFASNAGTIALGTTNQYATYSGNGVALSGYSAPASAGLTGTNSSSQLVAATGHAAALVLKCADTSASGTAQVCSTAPTFTPAANDCVIYTTTTANTGTGLTLNVNALGAKSVAKWLGSTTLAAGDVAANSPQLACYNGTVWNLSTIGNAPSGGGGGVTLQTNGTNNTTQTALNFITSTVNASGLTATPSNPATSSEKIEITGTVGAAAGGTGVSSPAAHSLVIAEGSSAFSLITSSSTNGYYQCGFSVTGSAAVDPSCALGGVPVNAQSSNYSLLYSDRMSYIKEAGGSTATLTLPQVTGNTAANMAFVTQNLNSGTETITANAVDKVDGGATGGSQTLPANSAAFVYQDSSAAPGNWWTLRVPTVAALEQGSAGQVLLSGGASALPTAIDLPDVKVIPAANCVSSTAGSSWNTTLTPACIGGTNNLGGSLPFVDALTAQFEYEIPGDWDSTSQPYFALFFNSGTNTSGTVIFNVAVACTKSDGSVSSDPAFNTADALTTKTMAAASRMWSTSVQSTQVTSGNSCVAGGTMMVKFTRATDTAAAAVNVTKASITFARKPVVQAN